VYVVYSIGCAWSNRRFDEARVGEQRAVVLDPRGGRWQAPRMMQVREFSDGGAPVPEMPKPGERYRRTGVAERGGEAREQLVLHADGMHGYLRR
jgi:hypothetical protein